MSVEMLDRVHVSGADITWYSFSIWPQSHYLLDEKLWFIKRLLDYANRKNYTIIDYKRLISNMIDHPYNLMFIAFRIPLKLDMINDRDSFITTNSTFDWHSNISLPLRILCTQFAFRAKPDNNLRLRCSQSIFVALRRDVCICLAERRRKQERIVNERKNVNKPHHANMR